VEDETAVTKLAQSIDIDIQPINGNEDGRQYTVMLNGTDVTWEIRSPQVDGNVSQVSTYQAVRKEMVRRQREFGSRGKVIMVGRDIGTVVMPDAPLKLYVNASPEERARRRCRDRSKQGHEANFEAILADVIRRDKIDSSRKHSPLRPAVDALHIDSTNRPAAEIAAEIAEMVRSMEAVSN
jgi:cytidylate kinase